MQPKPLFELRRELGTRMTRSLVIYLDMNHWIGLRDAAIAGPSHPYAALLLTLRSAVSSGRAVCTAELNVLLEVLKQKSPERRAATVSVIDDLTHGVVLASARDRLFLEVLRTTQSGMQSDGFPDSPRHEVWTRAAFVIGHGQLASETLKAEDLATLNLQLHSRMWSLRLGDVLSLLGDKAAISFDWASSTATRLNAEKQEARNRFAAERDVYLAEVRGILDANAETLGEVFDYIATGGELPRKRLEAQDAMALGSRMAAIVHAAFELHDLSRSIPAVHVPATLYARVQWNATQQYKANDFSDFGHAAAALPYCDIFATERSLTTLLRQTGLDELYDCAVAATPEELLDLLKVRLPGSGETL